MVQAYVIYISFISNKNDLPARAKNKVLACRNPNTWFNTQQTKKTRQTPLQKVLSHINSTMRADERRPTSGGTRLQIDTLVL